MRRYIFFALLCFWMEKAYTQDAYHQWLDDYLISSYNLPSAPIWVLPRTEAGTEAVGTGYGGTTEKFNSTNTQFTLGVRRTVNKGVNQWDAGHLYQNQNNIDKNDVCLVAIWIRSVNQGGKVFLFAEQSTTYDKEIYTELSTTTNWQLYMVPFKAKINYKQKEINFGLHLATADQTIEIGGTAVINYANLATLNKLPIQLNFGLYDGAEANAPWRAEAEAQINNIRKANLNIKVINPTDVGGLSAHVEMIQHCFKFGTAVVSDRFNEGSTPSVYEEKLLNLDGKGHGFNEVVFENDLKWPGWEGQWFNTHEGIKRDIKWLKDRNISVRGHNLVWPGWSYSPPDINASQSPQYIIQRVRNHIKSLLSPDQIGDQCEDWDVINEITANNDYANHFKGQLGYVTGREFYAQVFKMVDSLIPNATLYLNDYVALENADNQSNRITLWQSYIDEILAQGGNIEGIGLQGHFGTAPTGIPSVKKLLDDFYTKYNLPMKVTEYDINNLVPPDVQAKYMNDILTICFAHPSMQGFLMWGFWDGAHWQNNAPIFNNDWTMKPSGKAFVDLVFNKWWTDVKIPVQSNLDNQLKAFKGKYRITITNVWGDTLAIRSVILDEDKDVIIDFGSTATDDHSQAKLHMYPNPASSTLTIDLPETFVSKDITVESVNAIGQSKIIKASADQSNIMVPIHDLPNGLYMIRLKNGNTHIGYNKVMIEK